VGAVVRLGVGGLYQVGREGNLDLTAERSIDLEMEGQVGDAAVQRGPLGCTMRVTAEERNERVDRWLPEIDPVPGWADGEADMYPERAVGQLRESAEPIRYLLLEVIGSRGLVFNIDHTNAMAYARAAGNLLSSPVPIDES